jgi:hypothetical protein
VLVAPAVLAVVQRVLTEHWTLGELVGAVKSVAEEYRPRVKGLARSSG